MAICEGGVIKGGKKSGEDCIYNAAVNHSVGYDRNITYIATNVIIDRLFIMQIICELFVDVTFDDMTFINICIVMI